MNVKSFLIEDALCRSEASAEIAHLEEVSSVGDGEVTARTITFLRLEHVPGAPLPTLEAGDIIGQAVVITYPRCEDRSHSFVFEAVFRLCAREGEELLLNNEIPIANDFTIEAGGQRLTIRGSYFCQQNGLTSVCAHSAVRTLLMNHDNRRMSVAELNQAWNIDPRTGNIVIKDVMNSLDALGLTLIRYEFKRRRVTEAMTNDGVWSLIASLAQSGTPTLLVFETGPKFDHVVPVLGHTLNTDEWHPQGSLSHMDDDKKGTSSSLWVDHLVINDDQLGPYFCMSRSGLFEDGGLATAIKPKYVVAMLPPGFTTSPFAAETLARREFASLLAKVGAAVDPQPRWTRLLQTTAERRIFRTILISREEYLETLRAAAASERRREVDAILGHIAPNLPDCFWMCEVSLPNILLANKTRLGEILISTTAEPKPRIHAVRLPGVISEVSTDKISSFPFPIDRHIPIHAPHHNPNHW